ncbi:MAG: hypothetical protein Q9222_004012 [Ikaeria aurantiellina]
MATPQGRSEEQTPPSIDDIIQWNLEQLHFLGDLDFSTNFPTIDFFDHAFESTPLGGKEIEDDGDEVEVALKEINADYERVEARMQYMQKHETLLKDTEKEVHRRLLVAGKPRGDIENLVKNGTSLRQQISELHNLQTQHGKKRSNTVAASIHYGPMSSRRKAGVYLPICGTLAEFERMARVYLGNLKSSYEKIEEIYHEGQAWAYLLKRKPRVAGGGSGKYVKLETEADYRHLIVQMTRPGELVNLVLTQEGWPVKTEPDQGRKKRMQQRGGVDSLFDDIDLCRDLENFGKGQIRAAKESDLEKFAAAAEKLRIQKKKRDDMQTSRARHDQERVEHDRSRRASRDAFQSSVEKGRI